MPILKNIVPKVLTSGIKLETKKFRELKELYEKQMVAEEEDDLEEEEEK